jgi:hypothetical protein
VALAAEAWLALNAPAIAAADNISPARKPVEREDEKDAPLRFLRFI